MDVGKKEKRARKKAVRKNFSAAGAEATMEEKIVSTLMFLVGAPSCVPMFSKVWMYFFFLHIGGTIVGLAPRLAPASRPAFVPSVPAGYGFLVTLAVFSVATLVVQEMLARVLNRRPAPAPPLTPEQAWSLGIFTWMFLTLFFHNYLSFGGDDCFLASSTLKWALARGASAVNLFLASYTVIDYLA